MNDEGVVIVGANGSLGRALRAAIGDVRSERVLFDKAADPTAGIEQCDLEEPETIADRVLRVPFAAHRIWRLAVVSGAYDGSDTAGTSWDDVKRSLQINLLGVTQFVLAFIAGIRRARGEARIVVLSSAAARVGSVDLGYGIAKAGLDGLVRSVSKKYASAGITIIGVAPGIFASTMSDAQSPQRRRDAILAGHLGRACSLDEVAACVLFALFAAPDALTGTFVSPNAGQSPF